MTWGFITSFIEASEMKWWNFFNWMDQIIERALSTLPCKWFLSFCSSSLLFLVLLIYNPSTVKKILRRSTGRKILLAVSFLHNCTLSAIQCCSHKTSVSIHESRRISICLPEFLPSPRLVEDFLVCGLWLIFQAYGRMLFFTKTFLLASAHVSYSLFVKLKDGFWRC